MRRRNRIPCIAVLIALLAALAGAPPLLRAHSAGTDSHGCHHDSRKGEYHCHSGPLAGRSYHSREEMLQGLARVPKGATPPAVEKTAAPAAALATPPASRVFSGRAVGIMDGDTLEVLDDGHAVRIRLYGVDCPEKRQPFGAAAKRFTSEAAFGKTVKVTGRDVDQYGRLVAEVELPDGKVLNQELVRAGLAWWYRRYAPDDARLAALQEEAQQARAGLWRDAEPTAPWAFRKAEKIAQH